jgi:hypothetical protein
MTLADYMYGLETRLMEIVARNLVRGNKTDWQEKKLSQLGLVNAEVVAEIKKARKEIKVAAGEDMEGAARRIMERLKSRLPKNYKDKLEYSPELAEKVFAWINTTDERLNESMSTLAQSAGRTYVNAVNTANMRVITGVSTLDEAIKEAVKDVPRDKLTVFYDKAGRAWSPEGYARMVVRTNQGRVVSETLEIMGEQLGTDLVEISSHMGARPKCAPYQGRIYSRYGKTPGYPLLSETSYGEPDGIEGINCGHILYPFVPGVSKQTYKPYPEKANDKAYELSQQQRALESQIRNAKRQESVLKAGGDTQGAAVWREKVKENQAALREFIDETGRTRQYQRERVFT